MFSYAIHTNECQIIFSKWFVLAVSECQIEKVHYLIIIHLFIEIMRVTLSTNQSYIINIVVII